MTDDLHSVDWLIHKMMIMQMTDDVRQDGIVVKTVRKTEDSASSRAVKTETNTGA